MCDGEWVCIYTDTVFDLFNFSKPNKVFYRDVEINTKQGNFSASVGFVS